MERDVVIAVANSPGVLNSYVWIAWRSWVLKTAKGFDPLLNRPLTQGFAAAIASHVSPHSSSAHSASRNAHFDGAFSLALAGRQ
jgi:hypothetical protein